VGKKKGNILEPATIPPVALFFNEADAIISKRTDIRHSNVAQAKSTTLSEKTKSTKSSTARPWALTTFWNSVKQNF
jgi:hypothetical protein